MYLGPRLRGDDGGNDKATYLEKRLLRRVERLRVGVCSWVTEGMPLIAAAKTTGTERYPPNDKTRWGSISSRIRKALKKAENV